MKADAFGKLLDFKGTSRAISKPLSSRNRNMKCLFGMNSPYLRQGRHPRTSPGRTLFSIRNKHRSLVKWQGLHTGIDSAEALGSLRMARGLRKCGGGAAC